MNGEQLRKSLINLKYLYNKAESIGDFVKISILRKEIDMIENQLRMLENLEKKKK